MENSNCEYHQVCGLLADRGSETNLCVQHFDAPNKDKQHFAEVPEKHRSEKRDDFRGFVFPFPADFRRTKFTGPADFYGATFAEGADFALAMFAEGVKFQGTLFGGVVGFELCSFLGKTIFRGRLAENGNIPIFSGVDVNFRDVLIDPPDALTIIDADLKRCRFGGTNLRKVQMINVEWSSIGNSILVYDETMPFQVDKARHYTQVERIYRDLKVNYEDRRDPERAGDFHYAEKEMRRKNPKTTTILFCLLTLYWLISGIGERYVRPLISGGVLLYLCTVAYLALGIAPEGNIDAEPKLTCLTDRVRAANYSLQVMTLLTPAHLEPISLLGKVVHTIQSIFGPVILGLFALAVRQRLKR